METLLIVAGLVGGAGLLWLTPRIDPDRRSAETLERIPEPTTVDTRTAA